MIFLNIEIKNKQDNILLSRIEVEADISFEKKATPSTDEVKQALSKELEVEKDLIVIKKIDTSFGETSGKVTAYQYLSKDEIKNIEPRNKKAEEKAKAEAEKKVKGAEEAKAAPAEGAKEEKPAEKPEEPPKEKAKEEEKKEEEKKE